MIHDAESLLDLADFTNGYPGVEEIQSSGNREDDQQGFATIRLALAFAKARRVLRLRAIVEGWDQQRVMRELY